MKILMIYTHLGYSGAPKMFAWVANHVMKDHEVKVCTYFSSVDVQTLAPGIEYTNLKQRYDCHKSFFDRVFWFLRMESAIFYQVLNDRPDVLISFGDIFATLLLPLFRLARVRTIYSERGDPNLHSLITRVRKRLFSLSTGMVFQTIGARDSFSPAIQKRSVVIENPVTFTWLQQPLPMRERKKEISFVGRFEIKQKRHDVMLEAFALFLSKHPGYVLVFYGIGDDMELVRSWVHEKGLDHSVVFAGMVDKPMELISQSTLYVTTSDYEGLSNSLIEAMVIGLPIVATDCRPGGARALIKDGINGYIVPTGDAHAVCDAMCKIVENPDIADKMGIMARRITDRLHPDIIASKWLNAIQMYCKY